MSEQAKHVDSNHPSGAVRSADGEHLDWSSLPWLGLLGVARTAKEGATKYGRLNYMQGMSSHSLINRAMSHVVKHLMGDRSEPNLSHAAWGLLAAIQSEVLNPELCAPHMLGPGMTLTEANKAELAAHKGELAAKRKAGEFDGIGNWDILSLPEVVAILAQRKKVGRLTTLGEALYDEYGELFNEDGSRMSPDDFEAGFRRMLLRRTGRTEFDTKYDPAADGPATIPNRHQAYDLDSGGIVNLTTKDRAEHEHQEEMRLMLRKTPWNEATGYVDAPKVVNDQIYKDDVQAIAEAENQEYCDEKNARREMVDFLSADPIEDELARGHITANAIAESKRQADRKADTAASTMTDAEIVSEVERLGDICREYAGFDGEDDPTYRQD